MPSTEFAIRNPVIQQQQRSCNKSVLSSLHQGPALGPVAGKLVIMMNICTGSIRVKGPFYCTITIKGCVQCTVYVSTLCVHFRTFSILDQTMWTKKKRWINASIKYNRLTLERGNFYSAWDTVEGDVILRHSLISSNLRWCQALILSHLCRGVTPHLVTGVIHSILIIPNGLITYKNSSLKSFLCSSMVKEIFFMRNHFNLFGVCYNLRAYLLQFSTSLLSDWIILPPANHAPNQVSWGIMELGQHWSEL